MVRKYRPEIETNMSTVNIEASIVLKAAQHALIDAEAEYVIASKEYEINSKCHYTTLLNIKIKSTTFIKVDRIKTLIAAAKVCSGDVSMSLDDVGMIREWL